uniref:Uncharacterized protein n=1 Tax=Chenopodium quinoa TaxID=63459 RepID=A0A803KN75_CHEQI
MTDEGTATFIDIILAIFLPPLGVFLKWVVRRVEEVVPEKGWGKGVAKGIAGGRGASEVIKGGRRRRDGVGRREREGMRAGREGGG